MSKIEFSYVVEKILQHDTTYPDVSKLCIAPRVNGVQTYTLQGEVWYEIKWLGYDGPQDLTWEKESNLE